MAHFAIEFDRHDILPTEIRVYDTWQEAEDRIAPLEQAQLEELNRSLAAGQPLRMEYVVITSASVETVQRTHGRYFSNSCTFVIHCTEISRMRARKEIAEEDAYYGQNGLPDDVWQALPPHAAVKDLSWDELVVAYGKETAVNIVTARCPYSRED